MNRTTSNTFKYSNNTYTVAVDLYTKTSSKADQVNISLDPVDIEEIVYESRLNDLMLTGHIVYIDRYAAVDKMLGQHFGYVNLMFALNKKKSDNDVMTTRLDDQNKLVHNFVISDIKVVDRKASIIKYQIDMVSMNWFKCISNLQFSNYSSEPQPLLDILKACLSSKGLRVDEKTFSIVKSTVALNYITQLNDNVFTAVNYLLHKMYYYPTKDDSVKFLVYDYFNDQYGMLDLKNKETSTGSFSTVMSFFKTNTEALVQQDPTSIGSLRTSLPKTAAYANAFEKDMSTYDYSHDAFGTSISPTEQSINYFNNKIDNGNYEQKYLKMFDIPASDFIDYGAYWNNDLAPYNKTVQMLEENNAFILDVTGEIRRQPGSFNTIALDRKVGDATNENKSELEKMKQKYRAYEGLWIASKVRSIISPQRQTFRQQVVLFRNFIPRILPVKTLDEKNTKDAAQSAEKAAQAAAKESAASRQQKPTPASSSSPAQQDRKRR